MTEKDKEINELRREVAQLEKALTEAEPTFEQIKEYCRKRNLVVLTAELYHEMQTRWSAEPKHGDKPMPTIETEPVKHGRWVKNEDRSGWHCSCCGKDDLYAYPYTENNERELQDFYCPNCGADMREVEG